MKGDISQY